jgi:DTW domain-containing protein YfiP
VRSMATRTQFSNIQPADRCDDCCLRRVLCICEFVTQLDLKTKVIVLIHHRETRRPSNTGKLARLILKNCEIRVRGLKDNPMSSEGLVVPERQSILLFPSINAVEITEEVLKKFDKPLTLIVPDGNWRQASRVPNREPALFSLPRLKVPMDRPSEYRLRVETRPEGLATFEAIARAMGVIEGAEVQKKMEALFKLKVERTLWSRAKITLAECTGGIPEAAIN